MYTLFVILHIAVCLVLCVVILLQSSKGGGLAGAFGGGGAPQQIFGSRGMTTLLHKLTIYCAVGFFITSAVLFGMTADRNRSSGSVVQDAVDRGALAGEEPAPFPTDQPLLPGLPSQDQTPSAEGTDGVEGTSPPAEPENSGGQAEDGGGG